MKFLFLITSVINLFFLFSSNLYSQEEDTNFIKGTDISFVPQIEDLGGTFKDNNSEDDLLNILSSYKVNYIRLRLWNNPTEGYCNLEKTLLFAKRIKEKNFKLLLDFHYSDWWADPGKQNKPAAWKDLTFEQLQDSVYSFSFSVISALKNQNTLPDIVQIGNEVIGGMLWPDGKIYGVGDESSQWIKFADLVKSGINGVNDAADTNQIHIMIHIDRGGDYGGAKYFYDHILAEEVEFDIIGLSYYPWWHGTFDDLQNNLNSLAENYQKDIIIVETAYPNNNLDLYDGMTNVGFDESKLLADYPLSVHGQKDYIIALSTIINEVPNGRGKGFFYWEPTYISVSPIGSAWEYFTLFDPISGNALESLDAYRTVDSLFTNIQDHNSNLSLNDNIIFSQNYPNPFNPVTNIIYTLKIESSVQLSIYNSIGEKIITLENSLKNSGQHNLIWNGKNSFGNDVPSGIYIAQLRSELNLLNIKMMLIR